MKNYPGRTPALNAYRAGKAIAPLGFLPNGRPIFPIAGGADDDPPPSDDPPKDFEPITSQEEFDRRITGRINQARTQERARFSDYEDLKAKAAERDQAIEAAKTEHEKAVEAARNEGKTAALETANARLLSAEARALAAEAKFRNPALAVKAIDLGGVTVSDDGTVDAEAIKTALKALGEAEPYLIDDGKTRPQPDPAQGGGGSGTGSSVAAGRELYAEKKTKTSV